MTYQHAIVWLDHREAKVIDFSIDHKHVVGIENLDAPRKIHRKAGIIGDGHEGNDRLFYDEVVKALGTAREVVIAGPGLAKNEFKRHIDAKHAGMAKRVVGVESMDHPSEGELLSYARKYFKRVDALRGDV